MFLFLFLSGHAAGEEPVRAFDVPAGEAADTLKLAARQAGLEIVFFAETVRGIRTRALRGEFRSSEALHRLVSGTELVVFSDERDGTLTVRRTPNPTTVSPPVKSKKTFAVLGAWLALAIASPHPAIAADGTDLPTGVVEGRVFNPRTGQYISNARVSIEAQRLQTSTDEFGQYRFANVAAGEVNLRVFYTGFPAETKTVSVLAGQQVEQNFDLRGMGDTADSVVKLDPFIVASKRDMAASDVAVNEQRYAPSIKNIVSTDSFADIGDGNVGEFAKYIPGVTLNRSGSDGLSLSIGGVPPSGTPITLDGLGIASAASSQPNRTVEFENLAVGSMSRVEVTRSPTADSPASAIGGSVNLVSRNAFERSTPQYQLKTYLSFRGGDFSLKKQPGPFAKKQYPFKPNLEFNAVVPVTKNFGFTASALVARTPNNGPGTSLDWVPTVQGQSGSTFPATTPDQPYLARYRVVERPKITERNTMSLSADWRFSPLDVLSVGFQYSYFYAEFWVRQLNFDVGRVASFGSDFTQGATGAGFAQILTDARQKSGTTYAPSLRYRHNGPVWEIQVGTNYSSATNHYATPGYFQTNTASFRNLSLRFEKLTIDHPEIISAKDSTGRDVDLYNLANYRLENLGGLGFKSASIVRTLNSFARRNFDLRLPVKAKIGLDLRSEHRDMLRPTYTTSFIGADGLAQSPDDSAGQWFDPVYSQQNLVFGPRMQWFDLSKIGDTSREHPEYFTNRESDAVSAYRNRVNTSQVVTETIAAPYLRLDTKLFGDRLQLVGGVRYERTDDDGLGPLIDPTRVYQRDASGKIVRDSAGKPVVVAPLSSLAGTKLAYVERGSRVKRTYGSFFPSVNASLLLRPNLVARASFGHSINRPDFNNLLPSISLPDTESTNRIITLANPNLKPWFANSYGLALEYYFNQPSSGVISARVYRRDITDFWGGTVLPATDELLEPYGIDPAIYGEALGYLVSTTQNVGKAKVSGAEFDYRQNLAFLPEWARGFTVFGNVTFQRFNGSDLSNFSGFVNRTINWGVTYSRERFTVRLAVNLRGRFKQFLVTNAGAEPGTYQYQMPRNSADLTAEYRVTKNFSVYFTGRNVNEAIDDTGVYGPSTPGDRVIRQRVNYGATWYVGLKGIF